MENVNNAKICTAGKDFYIHRISLIKCAAWQVNFPHLAGCMEGWQRFGDSCYFYNGTERSTHVAAERDCRHRGGHIAAVGNAPENDFIRGLVDT